MRTAARQAVTAVARVEAKVVATQAVRPAAIAATTAAMLLMMMVDTAKVNMLAVMEVAQREALAPANSPQEVNYLAIAGQVEVAADKAMAAMGWRSRAWKQQ